MQTKFNVIYACLIVRAFVQLKSLCSCSVHPPPPPSRHLPPDPRLCTGKQGLHANPNVIVDRTPMQARHASYRRSDADGHAARVHPNIDTARLCPGRAVSCRFARRAGPGWTTASAALPVSRRSREGTSPPAAAPNCGGRSVRLPYLSPPNPTHVPPRRPREVPAPPRPRQNFPLLPTSPGLV